VGRGTFDLFGVAYLNSRVVYIRKRLFVSYIPTLVSSLFYALSMLIWDMKEAESVSINFGTRPRTPGIRRPVTT
jgi:hypothetical protein